MTTTLVGRRYALTLFLHFEGEAFDHRSNPPKLRALG